MARVLDKVNVPRDLDALSPAELAELAGDVRTRIIETVSRNGGHLAANLGVVELTIALLRVFNPPEDRIVWDTSHQTYAYKILTGRKDRFATLRQAGGISGFARREESPFDAFGAGHAGTALSAALGMAVARDRRGAAHHVVAVLGDGAAGCGLSLEAFNNVADATRRLIVILNDNEMSIAENTGALSRYFGHLLANPRYNRWKRSMESAALRFMRLDRLRSAYYRVEEAVKSLFVPSVIFEEFGLRYIGPVDGHNIPALLDALTIARNYERPILIHVSTVKGKGYAFAEEEPEKWHGPPSFDVASGQALAPPAPPSYSSVFGQVLVRLAARDDRIVAITAAMPAGTGLAPYAARYPSRFFDVGISEEHAVVFAAGLAAEGLLPVFAVYSTFAQRAIDCIIHDVCLQNLPMIVCLDRAGIVGDDGPTHHGVFDLALLAPVPGLVIMQPKDENELADMLYTATQLKRPVVIRYPRGAGPGVPVAPSFTALPCGRAEVVRPGREIQIWALGDMVPLAVEAARYLEHGGHAAGVVNARFVRPLDRELLQQQAAAARVIATVENGVVRGGLGALVEEALAESGYAGRTVRFGWPDEFVPHGPAALLFEQAGLTPAALAARLAEAARPA